MKFTKTRSISWLKYVAILILGVSSLHKLQGQVLYEIEPSVEKADEKRKEKIATAKKINGYRIFIGFSNKKSIAQELLTKADEKFGTTFGAQIIFDEPNFKVYIGTFTTQAEADAALVEIRKEFPTARKLKMLIPNPNYVEPTEPAK